MIKKNMCICKEYKNKDVITVSGLYDRNFIPIGFNLKYKTLEESEERILYLDGKCKVCDGYMCFGVVVGHINHPKSLLQRIWDLYNTHRPYCSYIDSESRYNNDGLRYKFYTTLLNKNVDEKFKEFCSLFNKNDQPLVKEFLEDIRIEEEDKERDMKEKRKDKLKEIIIKKQYVKIKFEKQIETIKKRLEVINDEIMADEKLYKSI